MVYAKKTPVDLKRRRGRVLIHEDIIDNFPEDILAILSHFVVVRAEFYLIHNAVEYQGYSHLFEVLSDGEEIPEYSLILTRNWRGQVTTIDTIRKEI